jgi:hypothetical protein
LRSRIGRALPRRTPGAPHPCSWGMWESRTGCPTSLQLGDVGIAHRVPHIPAVGGCGNRTPGAPHPCSWGMWESNTGCPASLQLGDVGIEHRVPHIPAVGGCGNRAPGAPHPCSWGMWESRAARRFHFVSGDPPARDEEPVILSEGRPHTNGRNPTPPPGQVHPIARS